MTRSQRFWSKVDAGSPMECWPFLGTPSQVYGAFWNGERIVRAHRFAYEDLIGPIPDGMTLDHLCRNTRCVNPDHLDPVSLADNIRRSKPFGIRATRAACVNGHPWTDETLHRVPDGYKRCRECQRIAAQRVRNKKAVA